MGIVLIIVTTSIYLILYEHQHKVYQLLGLSHKNGDGGSGARLAGMVDFSLKALFSHFVFQLIENSGQIFISCSK